MTIASVKIKNIMSVDVEDYYQVSAFERVVDRSSWDNYESRVERNTYRILELFNAYGVKSTFFVLGWVAERHQKLVNDIALEGHEIACHGYSHRLVYNQTEAEFKEETIRSKAVLEDIIQKPVLGYRAASYSITQKSMWAIDILVELGFLYDSSIFPIRHDRYGVPDADPNPHRLISKSGDSIVEFPLSTLKIFNYRLPISGGGYFRLFPYSFTKFCLNRININSPFIFYLHPWEIDPDQPRIANANWKSKFRHYNNIDKCTDRLHNLISDFRFTSVIDVLSSMELDKSNDKLFY